MSEDGRRRLPGSRGGLAAGAARFVRATALDAGAGATRLVCATSPAVAAHGQRPGGGTHGQRRHGGGRRRLGEASLRKVASALLAAVMLVAGVPAAALGSVFDSTLGIRIAATPEAHVTLESQAGSTTVGIRLTASPAAGGALESQAGASTLGIRLTATPSLEGGLEARAGSTTVGIRLTASPEAAGALESQTGSTTVGIRLTATPEAAGAYESPVGSTTVGIRLTASPEQPAALGSRAGSTTVGIRLAGMESYNVHFATHGGSDVAMQRVRWGECAARPEDPSRDGYQFLDWFADEACTEPFDFGVAITGTTTVHAGWLQRVDVTLHANGAATAGGGWEDGAWTEECWSGDDYADHFGGFPDLGGLGLTAPEGKEFGGWWTREPETGAWGRQVAGGPEGAGSATVASDATDLWARWIESEYWVEVADESGTAGWKAAGTSDAATVAYGGPLPDGSTLYAGAEAPKRAGYMLAGLWQEGAGGADGADGAAGVDPMPYYVPDGAGLRAADALADTSWTDWRRAEDRYRWDGSVTGPDGAGAWVPGHDGVDDTVVLAPRWELAVAATVPVSLTFAITGFGEEAPVAKGPDVKAFAIRSRTVVPLRVTQVAAEGLPSMERVLYTAGAGAGRRLDYPQLGGDVALTVDPEGQEGARVRLVVADGDGLASSSAETAPAFALPAWGPGSPPRELHLGFGLELPPGARAYERGATGELARVAFTLVAQQEG